MNNIILAIETVFPGAQGRSPTAQSTLGDLPGWDSMNAVNLMVEINERCQVDIEGVPLRDSTTLDELRAAVVSRGGHA